MTAPILQLVDQPTDQPSAEVVSIASLRSTQELKKIFTRELEASHRDLLVYARAIVFDADQARDLVQESCVTAWSLYSRYDANKADFGSWVRGILRNKVRDWAKSKRGGKRPEVYLQATHLDALDQTFERERETPMLDRLKGCLGKLPLELSSPIKLTYYEGHSGEDASQTLGINHATFRKRLSRARQALHTCLESSSL